MFIFNVGRRCAVPVVSFSFEEQNATHLRICFHQQATNTIIMVTQSAFRHFAIVIDYEPLLVTLG